MLFTQKDLDVYGLIQPNENKIEKAKSIYEKLNLSGMMTFKGFYHLFGEEIQKINLSNIYSLDEMCSKIKKYKRHRAKLAKEGKLVRCFNCIWRKPRARSCRLSEITDEGMTYYANKHDNDRCSNFMKRDIW